MERLTQKRFDGNNEWYCAKCAENCRREIACENCEELGGIVDRLGAIEDILGDDYDLARLRELVTADKTKRIIIAPEYIQTPSNINCLEIRIYTKDWVGVTFKYENFTCGVEEALKQLGFVLDAETALAEKGERDGASN